MRYGVKITQDRTKNLAESIAALAGARVLVGFPAASDERQGSGSGSDARNEEGSLNNATIGYLMNTGIPERNVPEREFMAKGITAAGSRIGTQMQRAAEKSLDGDKAGMERNLVAVGFLAQSSIRNTIAAGIPPPLADSTLRARLGQHSGRKGESAELAARAAGKEPSLDVTPLINTGQLVNAISFVLRGLRRA